MSEFELLGGLPSFILASLFLAYLIWAKFLNKGNMSIDKKVDNLLDILAISGVLILSIPQVLFIGVPNTILNNQISSEGLFEGVKGFIIYGDLFLLFMLLIVFRTIKASRTLFNVIAIFPLLIHLIIFSLVLGNFLGILIGGYGWVYFYDFFTYTLISGLIFWLSYLLINNVFFHKKFREQELKFGSHKINISTLGVIFFVVLTSIFGCLLYFSLPIVKYSNPEDTEYYISSAWRESTIYSLSKTEVNILTFGPLKTKMSRIPIKFNSNQYSPLSYSSFNYGKIRLLAKRKDNSTFTIVEDMTNLKDNEFTKVGAPPFFGYILNKEKEVFYLYFMDNQSTKNISSIYFIGSSLKENGSQYSYDEQTSCNNLDCTINIIINNSLDKRLRQNGDTLINFVQKGIDTSTCFLANISYESSVKGLREYSLCQGRECGLTIRGNETDLVEAFARISEGILRLEYVNMEQPTNLVFNFKAYC